jgi:hypothetical protein
MPMSFLAVDTFVFAATQNGIFRSSDDGSTWIRTFDSTENNWFYSLAIIASDSSPYTTLFAGCDDGIYSSTDTGRSWHLKNGNGSEAFAVRGDTLFTAYRSVYFTTDGGVHWVAADSGVPSSLQYCLGPSETNEPSIVFLIGALGDGLYASTDNGAYWSPDSIGSPAQLDPECIVSYNRIIFVGTTGGVFLSTDNGTSWSNVSTGLGTETIWSLTVEDSFLYAATSHGVYRRPLSEIIPPQSAVAQTPPVSNALHIYPNPFSQSTEIAFTSATAGYADVSVVNVLGAPVAHLFSGELDAGEHEFAWDASMSGHPVAPGSYWCIVRMGDSVARIALSVQR